MAERLAAAFMRAALGGGQHEATGFDGAGAQENLPMLCFPGRLGEGGWNGHHGGAGFGQRAVKRGKTQVVADGYAEPAPRQIGEYRQLTGTVTVRLAVAFAVAKID